MTNVKNQKRELVLILRGIGIGFILASMIFFSLRSTIEKSATGSMSEAEIVEQAQALGMIKITDLDHVYMTDEEVIERAKELGMVMENTQE